VNSTKNKPVSKQIEGVKTKRRSRCCKIKDLVPQVVALCAKGYNESNAVILLDKFTVQAWFDFKYRGNRGPGINEMIVRAKQQRADRFISEIEKAATGTQGVRHDWRAAQVLAGIADPVFDPRPAPASALAQNSQTIVLCGGEAALRTMMESAAASARLLIEQAKTPSANPTSQPIDIQPLENKSQV
jgi:hypothetical protein